VAEDPTFATVVATSPTVTGTSASTAPFCVAGPLDPDVSQLLDVSAAYVRRK
jgi:hypothetical protein